MFNARRAFSMIELVIVVVIIGIIAAIAIPRMSRGAAGAQDSALIANLTVLRNAIDLFITEHEGVIPAAADIENALLQYSNLAGDSFSATKDTTHYYGPYLRSLPELPVSAERGSTGITATAGTSGKGWVYDDSDGSIIANSGTDTDATGTAYNTY